MPAVLATLVLALSCEACDALAAAATPHPFAINPSWRPSCDSSAARYIAADPWPAPGERRQDRFTRDCASVVLDRAFVPAPGGFTPGELYVATAISKSLGRGSTTIAQAEFIGEAGGFSYRYTVGQPGSARDGHITASVETPTITSHLAATALAPGRPGQGSGPMVIRTQSVSCETWRGKCVLMSRPDGGDVPLPYVTVSLDREAPAGRICLDPGEPDGGTTRPSLVADGSEVLVKAADGEGGCTTRDAAATLDRIAAARTLAWRPGAGNAGEVRLDTAGLREAIALQRHLFSRFVMSAPDQAALDRVKAQAGALLQGPAGAN